MPQSRLWQIAAGVSILVTLLAILLRPLWLDEYWMLFISGGDTSWAEAMLQRRTDDIHPPLSYLPLHVWVSIFKTDLAARLINILYMAGGFALAWHVGRDRPKETALYLFLAVTAFWFTFYGVEIRSYSMLYALSVATVPVLRRAIQEDRLRLDWLALWIVLAAAVGLTHYYGTLWIGASGLIAGLTLLQAKRPTDFFLVGVASVLAVAPGLAFAVLSNLFHATGAAQETGLGYSWFERMYGASVQVSRAIFGKTLLGNAPAWIATIMAAGLLFSKRERHDWVALGGPLLTIVLAMAVMAVAPSEMRERSYTGIVPPLIYFCARGLAAAEEKGGRAAWFARLAPWAAMLAPILFIPEHFKDRQRFPEVWAYLSKIGTCADQPVLISHIRMPQKLTFPPWYATHAIAPTPGGPPVLVNAKDATPADLARIEASPCPVKAIALGLARGEGGDQTRAREGLKAAGFDLATHEEVSLGRNRNILFMTPGSQLGAAAK